MKFQSLKILYTLLFALPILAQGQVAIAQNEHSEVVGVWKFSYQNQGGEVAGTLIIMEEDGGLEGNIKTDNGRTDSILKDVKFEEGLLSFKYTLSYNSQDLDMIFSAKISDKTMKGAIEVASFNMGFDLMGTKEEESNN